MNQSDSNVSSTDSDNSVFYEKSPLEGALRQGEIISGLSVVRLRLESDKQYDIAENTNAIKRTYDLAIVITQDCDLDWDFNARNPPEEQEPGLHRLLTNILFCEVEFSDDVKNGDKKENFPKDKAARSQKLNKRDWDLISQNRQEQYHLLNKVEPFEDLQTEGISSSLVVEFRRYFSLPTEEVYRQLSLSSVKRRCVLSTPYLEHFNLRFHYYHNRVALPQQPSMD